MTKDSNKKSDLLEEVDNDPSGFHDMSIEVMRGAREGIHKLINELSSAKEQAEALVHSVDVPPVTSTGVLPAGAPAPDNERLEAKLHEMSLLVQKLVDPVKASLREMARDRTSRKIALLAFSVMLALNVAVSVATVVQGSSFVREVQRLREDQLVHRLDSGLTSAQVEALLKLQGERASSPELKAKLKQIEHIKDKPDNAAAQAAVESIKGPSKEVIQRVLAPQDGSVGD